MRKIETHILNEQDRQPQVFASDTISVGGAPDAYRIMYEPGGRICHIPFITLEHPGVTNESLLAIIIDRLEGFQAGEFPCVENEKALEHARQALGWLNNRTLARQQRGVEGQAKE